METEYILIEKQDLEALKNRALSAVSGIDPQLFELTVNQKQLAQLLKWSEPTVIAWKRKGLLPVEQLPGSRKCTYNVGEVKLALRRYHQSGNPKNAINSKS